ncbi:MAG: hypothetical protein ACXWP4_00305 [Polyangiales bacterium]
MRIRTIGFTALLGVAAVGCTRGGGHIARDPVSPTASKTVVPTTREDPAALDENDKIQPVYNAQKGFEDQLPPPESDAKKATNSDVGKPRWRNSPGTFIDDPSRYPLPPANKQQLSAPPPEAGRGPYEQR